MAFILPIKSLLPVLWPAGIRLAVAGTADEEGQRMNENDHRVAEQIPNKGAPGRLRPAVDSARGHGATGNQPPARPNSAHNKSV